MKRRRSSGYTLVELAIALGLVTILMGSVISATQTGQSRFEQSVTTNALETKSGRTLNRIVKELLGAGMATLDPPTLPPFSSEFVEFRVSGGWNAGTVDWREPTRLELELSPGEIENGLDDNDNGLVDEGRVVLVQDLGGPEEVRRVLGSGVSLLLEGEDLNGLDDNGNGLIDESGLCFEVRDNHVVVRLTMEQRSAEGLLFKRTLRSVVALRN